MEEEQAFPISIDFIADYFFNDLPKSARKRSLQEQLYLSNESEVQYSLLPKCSYVSLRNCCAFAGLSKHATTAI
jgi:hypothetical protein